MRRITRGAGLTAAATGACVALAAGLGCNAIVGIQDGVLVTIDSGTLTDGTAADGSADTGGGMDGPVGDAGGMDSTTASDSTSPPVDASDGSTPPPIRCSINPGSKTLVADLSAFADGGASCCGNPAQFGQALWAFPMSNDNNGVEIFAQNAADQTDFSMYQLNFGQGTPLPTPVGSSTMGGVRLLDVEPTPAGPPVALTTVSTTFDTQALQVVPLPAGNGGTAGTPTTITGSVLTNQYPNSASLLPLGSNAYDWILAENGSGTSDLISGNSGNMQVTLVPSTSQSIHTATKPFDLGGNLYTFVQGLGDAGNGNTVFAYPDNFSGTGTEAPVVSSASLSAILLAHVSTADSTKAALVGATIDSSGAGSAQIWSALLPASSLTSLTLGAPQFTVGSSLSLSEVPFNQGTTVPYGDQFFLIGTGQGDQTTLLLLWVNAAGVALAHPAVMGPLLSTGNVVRFSTLAVGQVFSQFDLQLYVAWVEENGSGSTEFDQLWAAQVTCQPFSGD